MSIVPRSNVYGFGVVSSPTPFLSGIAIDPLTVGQSGFPPDQMAQAAQSLLASMPAGAFVNPIGKTAQYPWPLPPDKATVRTATGGYADYYNVNPAPDPSGLIVWTGADSYQAVAGLNPTQLLAVQIATGPDAANGKDASWSLDFNPKTGATSARPVAQTGDYGYGGTYYSASDLPKPATPTIPPPTTATPPVNPPAGTTFAPGASSGGGSSSGGAGTGATDAQIHLAPTGGASDTGPGTLTDANPHLALPPVTAPADTTTAQAGLGGMLSSLPWWAWAALGGVVLLSSRRRRA